MELPRTHSHQWNRRRNSLISGNLQYLGVVKGRERDYEAAVRGVLENWEGAFQVQEEDTIQQARDRGPEGHSRQRQNGLGDPQHSTERETKG